MSNVAETVAFWIDNNYRDDRLNRDAGTRARIVADRIADIETRGDAFISRHDSKDGQVKVLRRSELGCMTSNSAGRTTLYY